MARSLRSVHTRARLARGWSIGFYIAGVAALGTGLLAGAIVAAATGTAAGLTVAAVIAATGAATGGLGLFESRRFRRRAERLERTVSEQRLYALARQHQGVLQVVDVALGMRLTSADAEELLDHMVDEVRVSMRVTDDGAIEYVFRQLEGTLPAQVRVDVSDAESGREEVVEAPAAKDAKH